ncbi:MAG: fibronectin type III domain-containing protein [Myxococcota bacterium]
MKTSFLGKLVFPALAVCLMTTTAAAQSAPAAPSDLNVVVVNAGQANLSWTDNSADETEFRIQRADDEEFEDELVEIVVGADVTAYTDFTLVGLHTYFYRVFAVNNNGASPPSEEARIFTPASSPTIAVVEPPGAPAVFQSGVINEIEATATGVGADIATAEFQLLLDDAPGTFIAQDIEAEPDQDPFVIPAPIFGSPISDTTPVPSLPPGAILELQLFGRVFQAGDLGNGFEWRVGDPTGVNFIVYESVDTVHPRPRRPAVDDTVWIVAHRSQAPGPLVAERIVFRTPAPTPAPSPAPPAYKLAALYKGVVESFETAFAAPGVSYGGATVTLFNASDNLSVPFRVDAHTHPAFPAFVDEGLIPGNAVEVRFWVASPVTALPIARQIFPQSQLPDTPPINPDLSFINDDPVPFGLPPGTQLQFMIVGIITGIDFDLKTWQLGDPEDPIVVYGHALTIPVTDAFRVVPDVGDEVIVTARRTLTPGPLIADQILILADGPAPEFELGETRTQITYRYNGTVTDVGPLNGGTRWQVSTGGIPQEFILDDADEPAVIDVGPLTALGLGSAVTVEFLPATQVLPEDNWAELEFNPDTSRWELATLLPAVDATQTGYLFVRTTDVANQGSTVVIPAELLAGVEDTVPPDVTLLVVPSDPTFDTFPDFEFASTDPTATFQCSLSQGPDDFAPCTSPFTAPELTDGFWLFKVRATDEAGNSSDADYLFEVVVVDLDPPALTEPVPTFVELAPLKTSTVPVLISWSGTDDSPPITYELQEKKNAGSFSRVRLAASTDTEVTRYLSAGNTYQHQVRGTDAELNQSVFTTGPVFQVLTFQENSASISYVGVWTTANLSGSFGGKVRHASSAGASATLSFTGSSVAWVSTLGPDRGLARVYLDGVLVGTVDTYSPSTLKRRIAFTANVNPLVPHTLEVRVLGTRNAASTSDRVDLDAFLVLQ